MAVPADWQALSSSAISRRHSGDIHGAVEDMLKAISVARTMPNLAKEMALDLNYLADMYLECNAIGEAEKAIREAVELSRPRYPGLLGDNLLGLAEIQRLKGEYREALASAEEARRAYQQQDHAHGVAQADELIERIKTSLE
jgi:tetratricopeptide (TPR) repeat protein